MAVAIDDLTNIGEVITLLEEGGYEYRGEGDIPDRHLFVKGNEECRTHHIHVMVNTTYEWKKHILFRDYLIQHPSEVERYSDLKKKLASKFEFDREKYTDGKEEFILGIIEKAKANN